MLGGNIAHGCASISIALTLELACFAPLTRRRNMPPTHCADRAVVQHRARDHQGVCRQHQGRARSGAGRHAPCRYQRRQRLSARHGSYVGTARAWPDGAPWRLCGDVHSFTCNLTLPPPWRAWPQRAARGRILSAAAAFHSISQCAVVICPHSLGVAAFVHWHARLTIPLPLACQQPTEATPRCVNAAHAVVYGSLAESVAGRHPKERCL